MLQPRRHDFCGAFIDHEATASPCPAVCLMDNASSRTSKYLRATSHSSSNSSYKHLHTITFALYISDSLSAHHGPDNATMRIPLQFHRPLHHHTPRLPSLNHQHHNVQQYHKRHLNTSFQQSNPSRRVLALWRRCPYRIRRVSSHLPRDMAA